MVLSRMMYFPNSFSHLSTIFPDPVKRYVSVRYWSSVIDYCLSNKMVATDTFDFISFMDKVNMTFYKLSIIPVDGTAIGPYRTQS